MPWIDRVAGVVEAWYPGQEDGNAIAAVLYGDFNPSAKSPLTFPRSASSIPTARQDQWPGVSGLSTYTEKLNVGYRWYDATDTMPLFPFGFGLSYTTFQLSNLVASPTSLDSAPDQEVGDVQLKLEVMNTGGRAGSEVIQAYVAHPASNGEPPHQLCGFAKIQLKPGETKQVTLTVDKRALSIYDVPSHRWITSEGAYEILVGTSSRDLPLHTRIVIGHKPSK
jgi:beta-glucosidase